MSNSWGPAPIGRSRSPYPGPFTRSRQPRYKFYMDVEELVADHAAAVDAELRDL